MPTDIHTLADDHLRAALDAVQAAAAAAREAESVLASIVSERDAAIRAALAAGVRVVDVAKAGGMSRERIYQVRDGRR